MVTTTRSNQDHTMMLHTFNPKAMSLPSIIFLHRTFAETYTGQDIMGQGHKGKVKVKSRSHHDAAHLQPLNNVPAK